jgi:hypothetical protein
MSIALFVVVVVFAWSAGYAQRSLVALWRKHRWRNSHAPTYMFPPSNGRTTP